ncbi:MAG: CHASE domain-containing protein [Planctomycetaceae bacterium]|nr:CHASE domain-containing protein [Planctomycetaceae bacterium]
MSGGNISLKVTIALGVSYYAVAQVSRILAIPPDLPSAIWPAAGLALAAMLIWGNRSALGLFLGAWATNGLATFNPDAIFVSTLVGLGMASGSTLQAWFGATLVRRGIGYPNALACEGDIARFFLACGPVSCVVGASFGVTSLWLAGYTTSENYLFSWFTWWVGDSIGAIIFAPLMLILFAASPTIWSRRRLTVGVPLGVCLLGVVIAFLAAKRWESDRQNLALARQGAAITAKIDRALQEKVSMLQSVTGLYRASNIVTKEGFAAFVSQWTTGDGVVALEWVPRVYSDERQAWEYDGSPLDIATTPILEKAEGGTLVYASNREEYFPIQFIEPLEGNEPVLGYDLASNDDRRAAMELARDTAQPTASEPVRLVNSNDSRPGVLLFAPIYRNGTDHDTVEQRRANLIGFALGVFRMNDLVCAALSDEPATPVQLQMVDASVADDERKLAVLDLTDGPTDVDAKHVGRRDDLPHTGTELRFAGRTWRVEVIAKPEYLALQHVWSIWMVLVGGMISATLFAALLLTITGKTDATEQLVEQRTRELELAMRRAEAATQAKSEFLASMSHELRTPLTAILGFAEAVQGSDDRERFSAETVDSLRTIARNGEHLLTLINDILDLSKIEAGKLKMEPCEMSPFELIDDVMRLMTVRADVKDLELRQVIATSLPESLLLDPVRVRQVLVNLLGNGIKFTNSGFVELRVSCVDIGGATSLQFEVSDSGIGMTSEQAGHIFHPFTQADGSTTRKFGGTGLGLTISRRLARMLGGDISVTSAPGVGSCFTVRIPTQGITQVTRWLTNEEYVSRKQVAQVVPIGEKTPAYIGGRVLLAEDGPDNQRLISFLLRKADVTVTLVENGRDAVDLAIAANPPFDLVLMDMQMPVLDGYDAVQELRSRDYTGPIVALTANAMSGDRDKCLAAGCDGYAAKPIARAAFLSLVASYITPTPVETL